MTQKNIKLIINEIYSKPPKKNYPTNKTDVYHIDDTWSLDILNLKTLVLKTIEDIDTSSYHRQFLKIWFDIASQK